MKKNILFFLCIFITFLIVFLFFRQTKYEIPLSEKVVNNAIGYNIKFICEKYKFIPFGTTIAMPEGDIQYIELKFQIYGPLKKTILRKILIEVASDFLNNIYKNTELHTFLNKGKLDIQQIGIEFFLIDRYGKGLDHPNIAIASISKGKLEYLTLANDEENFRDFVSKEQESFEEAIQILQSEGECLTVQKWCTDLPKQSAITDKIQ